ncbi:MAG: Folate-dependent protein for Fe/S cluster synthesis/repair in oxidative stress [Micavibrio sp.]|nr:Folate-dependent protein for Fe/S cluster synthesis/repair in oxidative stress [Micavibrio sp.]
MSSSFFVKLPDRGAVLVSGPDARNFLQGLITNDINLLDSQPMAYSCLLTPQGKFMFDFFMTKQGDAIQLECEGGIRASMLMNRLNHFKLRSKVILEAIAEINVFQIVGETRSAESMPDPRHPGLGFRAYVRPDNMPEYAFNEWDRHRILLGVPDGSRDMKIDQSTMADGRIDQLNGVSYTKGCYMGQELTARVHYRGLAKRSLVAIQTRDIAKNPFPVYGGDLKSGATLLGEMRSSCGDVGLALLKDDGLALLNNAGFSPL